MRSLLIALFMLLLGGLKAQAPVVRDCLSVNHRYVRLVAEVGGNGGVYSISYEGQFRKDASLPLRWRAGISLFPRGNLWTLTVPASVNYHFPVLKGSVIIAGAGQTLILSNGKGGYIRGTFRAGYRYYFKRQHAFIEAAYTPFYSYLYNFQWDNWVGVGFGWIFDRK